MYKCWNGSIYMSLSPEFQQRIHNLYREFIKYDATQSDRLNRYRNIEPESAQFLAMLIRIQQSKRILEIGTSTGYSTLWLADAAQVTQARVTTIEIDAERTRQAQDYAKELELDHVIDFKVLDAQIFLNESTEQYDFILLDAERDAYLSYWNILRNMINHSGAVLIVDNVISHAAEVKSFICEVKKDSRFMTTTLALGTGLFMVSFKD